MCCSAYCHNNLDDPDEVLFTLYSAWIHPNPPCVSTGSVVAVADWNSQGWDLPAGIEQLLRHSSCCLPKINSKRKVIFPFALTNTRPIRNQLSSTLTPPAIRLGDHDHRRATGADFCFGERTGMRDSKRNEETFLDSI